MWVRHQKRACVVGRAYSDEACTLASGFGVNFEWIFATANILSQGNERKNLFLGQLHAVVTFA